MAFKEQEQFSKKNSDDLLSGQDNDRILYRDLASPGKTGNQLS
jgi:hypothetical protein